MKLILSLLFLLSVFSLAAAAQDGPPPPPLMYKAPAESSLKEFVDADKTFQATFPGAPETKQEKSEDGSFAMYRTYQNGSNSIIIVSESNFDIEAKKEKVYELARANFLKARDSKIESEKDVTADGIAGKEFALSEGITFRRVRMFVTGKRVYEIINDATNWHILAKHTPELVKAFNSETDRFFDSFKILSK